jgi:glutamate-1-semialdehyde 2,1-aminomutase
LAPLGTGVVNHSGTFNASVMAAAAVVATQRLLVDDPPYERIETFGTDLMSALMMLGDKYGVPLRVQGPAAAFHVSFGDPEPVRDFQGVSRLDLARYAAFATRLAQHGLWVAQRGIWYVSAAHGSAELNATTERFGAALAERLP